MITDRMTPAEKAARRVTAWLGARSLSSTNLRGPSGREYLLERVFPASGADAALSGSDITPEQVVDTYWPAAQAG
jgi:hypothetical protein